MSIRYVKLGAILHESKVESLAPNPDKRLTVKLNVKGIEKRPFEKEVEGGTKYFIRSAGQFIYGKQNLFKGAFGIVPPELDGFESSQDIPAFDVHESCLPEYLFFYFKQGDFYKSLESLATGTGSRRIQPTRLLKIEIPLPSVQKQNEIIEHLRKFEEKVNQLFDSLETQQTYIKLLRQTILQEAIQGKLTNGDTSESTPNEEKIEEIRRNYHLLKARKLGIKKASYKKADRIDLKGKTKGVNELFDLPANWEWVSLGQIVWSISDGPHFSPKYVDHGVPIISSRNISSENGLDFTTAKYVSKIDYVEFIKRGKPEIGDILYTKGGTTGIPAVVETDKEFCVWVHVALLKVIKEVVNPYYLLIALSSPFVYNQSQKQTHGTGNKDLGLTRMSFMAIPLPPLAEQNRIVSKVQQLQNKLKALMAQVTKSRQYAEQLLQSVLKEAFTGKMKTHPENMELNIAVEVGL